MNDNTNEYEQTIALTDIEDYLMSQLLEQYADALERGDTELTVTLPSFAYDLTGDATTGVSAGTVAEDIRRFADSSLNGHPDGAKPLTKKDATPEAVKLGIQL